MDNDMNNYLKTSRGVFFASQSSSFGLDQKLIPDFTAGKPFNEHYYYIRAIIILHF